MLPISFIFNSTIIPHHENFVKNYFRGAIHKCLDECLNELAETHTSYKAIYSALWVRRLYNERGRH